MSDTPANEVVLFSDSVPAAPAGRVNVEWAYQGLQTPGPNSLFALSGSVPSAGAQQILAPQTKWHAVSPVGVGSVGDPNTLTSYYLTTAGATVQNFGASSNGNPCAIEATINGGSGAFAQVGEAAFVSVYYAGFLALQAAVLLEQTTHTRCWIGISSLNGSNLQTDTPGTAGGQFVGFRYSTSAGDTHWQAVTADGVSQTVTSTGIVPDTNLHQFRVVKSGSSYLFYIDGVLVATNTTHLPDNTVGASDLIQLDAPGSSSGTFGFRCAYLMWWDSV